MSSLIRNGKRRVQVYIPIELFEKVERFAVERGKGMNELILSAVDACVANCENGEWT